MEIKQARFVVSNSNIRKCPEGDRPEYAFIGRSNVGKSSLINMITKRKKLAMTSSTPGKTQLINHFMINEEWYLVDLPGYGYAQRSKTIRETFGKLIQDYILYRDSLTCLFVLIDSRHEPQKIDLEFLEWLGENGIPFSIIFTKTDKITSNKLGANLEKFRQELLKKWEELPPVFVTSALAKTGAEELLSYIEEINKSML